LFQRRHLLTQRSARSLALLGILLLLILALSGVLLTACSDPQANDVGSGGAAVSGGVTAQEAGGHGA
jgi:hypothetical protein